jgi:hypothetical protein
MIETRVERTMARPDTRNPFFPGRLLRIGYNTPALGSRFHMFQTGPPGQSSMKGCPAMLRDELVLELAAFLPLSLQTEDDDDEWEDEEDEEYDDDEEFEEEEEQNEEETGDGGEEEEEEEEEEDEEEDEDWDDDEEDDYYEDEEGGDDEEEWEE